jgi:phosphoenolpyruvate synthase/pyruvate phosphate dikinase
MKIPFYDINKYFTMNKIFSTSWQCLGSWPGIGLSDSLIWQGDYVTKLFYKEFGIWKGYVNIFTDNGTTQHMYGRKQLFDDLAIVMDQTMNAKPKLISDQLKKYYSFEKEYKKQAIGLSNFDYKNSSNAELAEIIAIGRNLQSETALYDQFGILTEDYFLNSLNTILKKYISDETGLFSAFEILTAPWSLSTPQKEECAILKLINKLSKIDDFKQIIEKQNHKELRIFLIKHVITDINHLIDNFGWLPVFLLNAPWDENHYLREISEKIFALGITGLDKSLDLLKQVENIPLENEENYKVIKGICASSGKATGTVKVITDINDFSKFEKGDILVAASTTADYVPIMRKAQGIIAEHGGITCHAAIVSRELKIPAIVNYPLATKTFKDGQVVSFNAIEKTIHVIKE